MELSSTNSCSFCTVWSIISSGTGESLVPVNCISDVEEMLVWVCTVFFPVVYLRADTTNRLYSALVIKDKDRNRVLRLIMRWYDRSNLAF